MRKAYEMLKMAATTILPLQIYFFYLFADYEEANNQIGEFNVLLYLIHTNI
ncbi:hypothetical protein Lalb_Chr22g0349521 [Lupinus albus]|uniref:Uncharacterized protein n=1 Tax=Lupinus albus TaxID=3870 RepID=A0A6A4NEN6_LUPAL|nr:hypothetical protein Lalb_Chr22g0349521 [Lupinus albus]